MNSIRFSLDDLAQLPKEVQERLDQSIFQPEAAWCAGAYQPEEYRSLLISLTPENIDHLESMPFDQVIQAAEGLDDAYYAALPSFSELAAQYGDPAGRLFYRQRDLFHHYQKAFIADHRLRLYDVTDERQTGSRRY